LVLGEIIDLQSLTLSVTPGGTVFVFFSVLAHPSHILPALFEMVPTLLLIFLVIKQVWDNEILDRAKDLYYNKSLPTMVDAIMKNITVCSIPHKAPFFALVFCKLLLVCIPFFNQ